MDDPRLNGDHLHPPRRGQYRVAREEMLDSVGSETEEIERAIVDRRLSLGHLTVPANYGIRDVQTGQLYPLRVGINTIGRAPENDILLENIAISRRHCVILVHVTGGCEVYDTASRHGTLVNRRKVARVALSPGDVLRLCDYKFLVLGDVFGPVGFRSDGGSPETGNPEATRIEWAAE